MKAHVGNALHPVHYIKFTVEGNQTTYCITTRPPMAPTTRRTSKRLRGDDGDGNNAPSATAPLVHPQDTAATPAPPPAKRRATTRAATHAAAPFALGNPPVVETASQASARRGKAAVNAQAPAKANAPAKAKAAVKAKAPVKAKQPYKNPWGTKPAKPTPKAAVTAVPSKPAAQVAVLSAAATAFVTPHILDAIIGFLPAQKMLLWTDPHQQKHKWKRRDDAHGFLKAIAGICQALPACYIQQPSLLERVGPKNQEFWKKKLFQYFDFSVDSQKSIHFQNDPHEDEAAGFRDKEYVAQTAALAEWHKKWRWKQRTLYEDLYEDYDEMEHEPDLLVEEFQYWPKLHIYHRASHYGFLTEIQTGKKKLSQFPESINACELFQDLVFVIREFRPRPKFVANKKTPQNGPIRELPTPTRYACILRRMPKKVSPRGSDLLDVCGLMAQYWDPRLRMVSTPWLGLAPDAHRAIQRSWLARDLHESELVLHEETEIQKDDFFGAWKSAEDLKAVQHAVRDGLCDWRHVRLSSGYGPQFYIGKRKKTNRWVGAFSFTHEEAKFSFTQGEAQF